MKRSDPRSSRKSVYRIAWILFALSFLISRGSPLADAVSLAHQLQNGVSAFRFAGIAILVLCWFSNIVFVATPLIRNAPRISIGWRVLLLGSLVVNVAILIFFPGYAKELNYWIWLGAFITATAALLLIRPDAAAAKIDDGVPAILWAWLGFTVFWIAVMTGAYLHPAKLVQPPVAALSKLKRYFEDPARALAAMDVDRIENELAGFEKETSNQLAVVVYPQAPSPDIESVTIHAAEAWKVGRQGRDNGAILFLFQKERVARLEVGYGLEAALPDAVARRILDEQLSRNVAQGDYAGGIDHTVRAIMDRVRSEYSGGGAAGAIRTTWARLRSVATTAGPLVWPFLRDAPMDARLGISFFGTLIGIGIASGIANAGRIALNLGRGAHNLIRRRPFRNGMIAVELGSVIDTLKLVAVLLIPLATVVVLIAGGGAFGGAGATIHW
jgi:uncharacterized membrane protein YgcG